MKRPQKDKNKKKTPKPNQHNKKPQTHTLILAKIPEDAC